MKKYTLRRATFAAIGSFAFINIAHANENTPILTVIETNTANTTTAVQETSHAVTAGAQSIVDAIQELEQQETANITASQQADANMAQVVDRQNIATKISQERLSAMRDATSGYSSCNTIYGGEARQAFGPALLAYKEGLFTTDSAFLNNQRVINGQEQPSATSIPVTIRMSNLEHCRDFASQADIDQGLCPKGTAVSADPDADIDYGHLQDQTSMSPANETASQAFLRVVVDPLPFNPIPQAEVGTQQAQVDALERQSISGRLSIAYALIADSLTARAPIANDPQLSDWAEGTAKDTGYTPSANGQYFPNGVSLDDYEKLRANSWVEDKNFTESLSGASKTTLLKDLFNVEAFRAQVDVENKLLTEDIAAGIGALLANSIKANPTLN